MAPVLIRNVLDSLVWSTLDASQPTLLRRYVNTGTSPAAIVIPFVIFAFLLVVVFRLRGQQLPNSAKARNTAITGSLPRDLGVPRTTGRPQAASVPPPAFDDVVDPPPPYVPLQTLAPAHKSAGATLERPADTERNIRNHGQLRSMLDV
jgi:hypothetical protein